MADQANTIDLSVTDRDTIRAAMLTVPEGTVSYEGDCEIARLSYDQLRIVDGHQRAETCHECDRAFVSVHTTIVVVRNDTRTFYEVYPDDQDVPWDKLVFLHPWCWDKWKDGHGLRPVPAGPIAWQASDAPAGYATTGYIPTGSDGAVTITINGTPITVDLRAGIVFVRPDDDQEREVVAQFEPVPAQPGKS